MTTDTVNAHADFAELLRRAEAANEQAAEELFVLLYRELHALAERQLRRQGGKLTLGATTLVHEAYLNMLGRRDVSFPDRARFFAYAARAMRGLAIDYARRRRARKRGGHLELTLDTDAAPALEVAAGETDLSELGEALAELFKVDAPLAELVDLHFFGGLSFVEIAALRDVSERTVQRDWKKARAILHRALHNATDAPRLP